MADAETTWICLIRPAFDRAFLAGASEQEKAVVDAHGDYLTGLRAAGRLILAGRCWDGPFGAVIFTAPDRAAAERILSEDPSISAGVQTAELHEFNMPYPPVAVPG